LAGPERILIASVYCKPIGVVVILFIVEFKKLLTAVVVFAAYDGLNGELSIKAFRTNVAFSNMPMSATLTKRELPKVDLGNHTFCCSLWLFLDSLSQA
jgi:hypothetical protein